MILAKTAAMTASVATPAAATVDSGENNQSKNKLLSKMKASAESIVSLLSFYFGTGVFDY